MSCGYPTCNGCARHFWKWLRARMANMSRRVNGETSFAEAAATSVIGDPYRASPPAPPRCNGECRWGASCDMPLGHSGDHACLRCLG